jgi:hypothetical protein
MSRVLAVPAVLVALAGCGGGGPAAGEVLRDTADRMERIRSADLDMRLVLAPDDGTGRVGFALTGPVDLGEGKGLPTARLRYTQIAGEREGGGTFISTGGRAFVELGGQAYRVPDGALASQAGTVREGIRLPVGRWVRDPELTEDGASYRVSADLDAVAALQDIFGAAGEAGLDVPDLEGAGAEQLRGAVDSATVDLWSGREDRLLRRLRLRIAFRVETPPALRAELGELAGGTLAFDVALAKLNQPVRVSAPEDPAPALTEARGG